MRISKAASEAAGIKSAVVAMGTDTNLALLKEVGFDTGALGEVTPGDLVIALDAADENALEQTLDFVRRELRGGVSGPSRDVEASLRLDEALSRHPEINLFLISVPGRYAAQEAETALRAGKHVMIFSDNVSVADEKRLKAYAVERGLLLMGPDCGTAIINGIGLGFANSVPSGNVGIVAASGTGAQEVSSILARHGLGISQLIGTGGRDVSGEVGGSMLILGLEALLSDEATEVVVIISKLPDKEVADRVIGIARQAGKRCVVYFAGSRDFEARGNVVFARTLAETASAAAEAIGKGWEVNESAEALKRRVSELSERLPRSRRFMRGLFTGGTLAQEAIFLLGPSLRPIHTNLGVPGFPALEDPATTIGHTIVDLGDDTFTRGRAHPMIDQSYRLTRLAREIQDPETAVILLDVVLGYGCNSDPAGEIAAAAVDLLDAKHIRKDCPIMIASICGTQGDPQNYDRQCSALEGAGVVVAETNVEACELALEAVKGK
jgi:succinyl-CoA synthetase alpha subunit